MRRVSGRYVGVVAAALFIGLIGFSLWSRGVHHQWPWQALPDRVHVCARDFDHLGGSVGAGPYTRAQALQQGAVKVDSWWTFRGHVEVWATSPCAGGTPMGVVVRIPSGAFYGYGLEGGP